MFDELVEYIGENYSRASKIVELGVGSRIEVAGRIKKHLPLAEVLVMDNDDASVRLHLTSPVRAVADDVMSPQMPIYKDATLVYSIHPPLEIVGPMVELAGRVGAELLVVARSDEQEMFHVADWQQRYRNGGTVWWLRIL